MNVKPELRMSFDGKRGANPSGSRGEPDKARPTNPRYTLVIAPPQHFDTHARPAGVDEPEPFGGGT